MRLWYLLDANYRESLAILPSLLYIISIVLMEVLTMLLYSLLMFAVAIVFIVIGLQLHNGKTQLIHDYHQTKVTDKAAYGKAFSKAMFAIAITLAISGIIALFGETKPIVVASIGTLVIGIVVSLILILKVQKKYNNGIF